MMVNFTRPCPFTGQNNTMDIDVPIEGLRAYHEGALIQDAFPNITPDEREFIMTGLTPSMWDKIFPPEDEDEPLEDPHFDEDDIPF